MKIRIIVPVRVGSGWRVATGGGEGVSVAWLCSETAEVEIKLSRELAETVAECHLGVLTPVGVGSTAALGSVLQERARQAQNHPWAHDQRHTRAEWCAHISAWAGKAALAALAADPASLGCASQREEYRRRMVQVAALALAAVEAYDKGAG